MRQRLGQVALCRSGSGGGYDFNEKEGERPRITGDSRISRSIVFVTGKQRRKLVHRERESERASEREREREGERDISLAMMEHLQRIETWIKSRQSSRQRFTTKRTVDRGPPPPRSLPPAARPPAAPRNVC